MTNDREQMTDDRNQATDDRRQMTDEKLKVSGVSATVDLRSGRFDRKRNDGDAGFKKMDIE